MSNRPMDGLGRYGNPQAKVEFTPPPDLELSGEEGEALVKWRKKEGKICLLSMDGVALPGYEDEGAAETQSADEETDQ